MNLGFPNYVTKTPTNESAVFWFLWDIFVFRLVAYMLNMIFFKPTISIQNCIYINFPINLTTFLPISRDRNIRYNFRGSRSRAKVISFQPILPLKPLLRNPSHLTFNYPLLIPHSYLKCFILHCKFFKIFSLFVNRFYHSWGQHILSLKQHKLCRYLKACDIVYAPLVLNIRTSIRKSNFIQITHKKFKIFFFRLNATKTHNISIQRAIYFNLSLH